MTNHCETRLRNALKEVDMPVYYMKLQVHPLAHRKTVADFIVLTTHYNYAIECKECAGKIFSFDRLTQENELIDFHRALNRNESFVCILFWRGRMNKSYMFMIPLERYLDVKHTIGKKSMNIDDCLDQLSDCLLKIEKSQADMNKFLLEMQYKFYSYSKQQKETEKTRSYE